MRARPSAGSASQMSGGYEERTLPRSERTALVGPATKLQAHGYNPWIERCSSYAVEDLLDLFWSHHPPGLHHRSEQPVDRLLADIPAVRVVISVPAPAGGA